MVEGANGSVEGSSSSFDTHNSGSEIYSKHAPCIAEIQRGIASSNQINMKAKKDNLLLLLDFVTVHDYLFQLRLLAHCLQPLGSFALYYLAAAVSDFHIPPSRMSEHKIQSLGGGSTFTIVMDPVPKFLHHLVQKWAPTATIISFKVCPAANCANGILVGDRSEYPYLESSGFANQISTSIGDWESAKYAQDRGGACNREERELGTDGWERYRYREFNHTEMYRITSTKDKGGKSHGRSCERERS